MAKIHIFNLKCEYETTPMGVQSSRPLLSWQISADTPVMQEAYRIVASSSAEKLKEGVHDLMDTGKVSSSRSFGIMYNGRPPESSMRVFWAVRIWTQDDEVSGWSDVSWFEMGLLKESDWKGIWLSFLGGMVGNGMQVRHHFELKEKNVTYARAYVACVGYYEFHVNGKVVSDRKLDPAPTDISKTVLYSVYDVKDSLRSGLNVLGFVLGTGFAGLPKILLQLNIRYEDGTWEEVYSTYGESWVVSRGPITYNALYDGEDYDARNEREGWDTPEYQEHFITKEYQRPNGWVMCTVVENPGGKKVGQIMPPIRVCEILEPVLMHTLEDGTRIYDAGYNTTGWVRIEVCGKAGDKVHLSFAEVLTEDGQLEKTPLRTARCEDHYILKGDPEGESWEPRFTYHGFRYFSICTEGEVQIRALQVKYVHTALKDCSTFESDLPIFNDIAAAMRRTVACNCMGIPTDCAQRDERHGWQTDPTSYAESATYTFDMSGFYLKWLRDSYDSQDEQGHFADTAPYRWGWRPNDPQANIQVGMPLLLDRMYGNRREMEAHYSDVLRYIQAMLKESKDWMIDRSPYGEWACPKDECFYEEYGPGANPKYVSFSFVSTTFFFYTITQALEMARLLGKDEAGDLENLSEVVRGKINETCFHPETNQYDQGTQSANAMAIMYGLADQEKIPAILRNIVADLEKHDCHLTTGSVGTRAVIECLCENGYEDVAFRVMSGTTAPSFGYMVTHGATTIWERWEADDNNNIMNSFNQPMLTQAGVWFYKYLGGIRPDCTGSGRQHLEFYPLMPEGLGWVNVSLDTPAGLATSSWKREGQQVTVDFTVPHNVSARAKLSAKYGKVLSAAGVDDNRSLFPVTEDENMTEYELEAGKYRFVLSSAGLSGNTFR